MKRGMHDSQHRRLIGSSMPLNLEKLSGDEYKLKYPAALRIAVGRDLKTSHQ